MSGLGVVFCRGGQKAADSLAFKQLVWEAQARPLVDKVLVVNQLCQKEGALTVLESLAQNGLDNLIVGACPKAGPESLLAGLLTQGEGAATVDYLNLCQTPAGKPGACQVREGAALSLCQCLANRPGGAPAGQKTVAVVPAALIVGQGPAALYGAEQLAGRGFSVTLLLAGKRLNPASPFMGEEERQAAEGAAARLKENPAVSIITQGRLLALSGTAGQMRALIADSAGKRLSQSFGAVLVCQGPPVAANPAAVGLALGGRVLGFGELDLMSKSPAHLARLVNDKPNPTVALALGLGGESSPAQFAAACRMAIRLAGLGCRVRLFTNNAKVAEVGLESLSQRAREQGVLFFKGRPEHFVFRQSEGELAARIFDAPLGDWLELELDCLGLEETAAPDANHRALAKALGLKIGPGGSLLAARVNAGPDNTGRSGVFLAGPAMATLETGAGLAQAGRAAAVMASILEQGPAATLPEKLAVDRKKCTLCLTCVRACPTGSMTKTVRRPFANPLTCTGCGTCAAECPMDAIQVVGQSDRQMENQMDALLFPPGLAAQPPVLLAFACARSGARALRLAAADGFETGARVRLVEIPCAGKLDPDQVLQGFAKGADAVAVLPCHDCACFNLGGNTWNGYRLAHLKNLLAETGLQPQRLMSLPVAPSSPAAGAAAIAEALNRLKEMGPSPLKAQAMAERMLAGFRLKLAQDMTIAA